MTTLTTPACSWVTPGSGRGATQVDNHIDIVGKLFGGGGRPVASSEAARTVAGAPQDIRAGTGTLDVVDIHGVRDLNRQEQFLVGDLAVQAPDEEVGRFQFAQLFDRDDRIGRVQAFQFIEVRPDRPAQPTAEP